MPPEAIDVDLFSGPRGWDAYAADVLGAAPWGVELDRWACETSRAAGLPTLQADVAALDPLDFAPVRGVIASPPCPAFSNAGKGAGRAKVLQQDLHEGMRAAARGADRVEMARHRRRVLAHLRDLLTITMPKARRRDVRAEARRQLAGVVLVWEPARWAAALRPRFVALEQVPPVLELWRTLARELEAAGYRTWVGVLSSERYGVPQTRKRAFLLASLDGQPHPPEATHQAYVPGEPARAAEPDLFGPGLLPWVSMADALGWTTGRVGFPRLADDGAATEDGYRERDLRDVEEPAFNLTEKARSWTLRPTNDRPNVTERAADEPAPTMAFGHNAPAWTVRTGTNGMKHSRDSADLVPYERPVDAPAPTVDSKVGKSWKVAPEGEHVDQPAAAARKARVLDRRQTGGDGTPVGPRHEDEPAPTMTARGLAGGRDVWRDEDDPSATWAKERPATTVAGDSRVFPPGHKINADDVAAGRGGQQRSGAGATDGASADTAIRVTEDEAAILQSFPSGWPFQGNRTAVFQQIGNAVPPVLARAVLTAASAPTLRALTAAAA